MSTLNESELKARRDAVAKALKFINMRLKDEAIFSRQDLFGRDVSGRSDYVQWSRLQVRFLIDEGKIERANTSGVPTYHAVEEVEISHDAVTRHMRREPKPEEDLLSIAKVESAKALTNGLPPAPKPAPAAVILEEDEVAPAAPESTPSAPEPSPLTEPGLHEMLRALVDILPNIVTAIHRIEKKAVAIEQKVGTVEKAMAAISKDFTDLLALVEEKK